MHQSLADLVRRRSGRSGGAPPDWRDPLSDLAGFGPDPGNLRMRVFLPPGLRRGAGLLVALHGCTQDAAGFDHGCGWSELAAAHGFALLLPEQRRENNPGNCFSWFEPGDTRRGGGEAESIRAAVAHLVAAHGLDQARVCVTGLSAGGAMAAALLATHPDVFSAGAIIAGLPHGAATTVQEAFEAMAGGRSRDAAAWAALARRAAPAGTTQWPRVAIWQGEADRTVSPSNATDLARQWAALHGVDPGRPTQEERLARPGAGTQQTWQDAAGRVMLQVTRLPGLDHGVPIDPREGGRPRPFILDAGIAAPGAIAAFCGLASASPPHARGVIAVGADGVAQVGGVRGADVAGQGAARQAGGATGAAPQGEAAGPWAQPGEAIRRALRSAGLLR